MKFTVNQNRAVTERGNIIVSAGAGSGKTTVMIERILEKLKSGVGLDRMLIVTFTRSSAADMRVKLTERLYKLKGEKGLADIAAAALDALPSANIGTLHSYCQKLVKKYFFAAGIDPSAAVCEESESSAIKMHAVSDAVDSAWESGDTAFAAMYDMLSSRRSDDGVKRTVAAILDFALSMPDPISYLTERKADADCFAELDGIVAAQLAALRDEVSALKPELAAAGMAKHTEVIGEFCDYADGVIDDITSTTYRGKDGAAIALNERFKALKAKCKVVRAFRDEVNAAKSVDGEPYAYALRAAAYDAYKRYAERKRALGKMDYADLEHGAYAVLSDEACLADVARSVRYVFIDEFQDVNPLQSAIAERFKAAGAEMFVVGDVKQSIYGFRRCSPDHFINAVNDPAYTHIPLADNFRSTETVIDFINRAFDGVMTEDFGGVRYSDAAQRLVYGNLGMKGGKAGLYVLSPEQEQAAEDGELADGEQKFDVSGYSVIADTSELIRSDPEAEFVADCIVDWFDTHKPEDVGTVAVLLRTVQTPFCAALTAALDERGIKYNLGKKSKAKSYPEVVAITDILRCADNRFDDIALYTAMRSALGGFTDGELAQISIIGAAMAREKNVYPMVDGERRSYTLWQKVTAYDGWLKDRVDDFIAKRNEIAAFSLNHDCAEVLGHITARLDYFRQVYENNGNAAAVEALIEYAADRRCDVHAFLEHYDGNDFELEVSGGGNAVTISTVHASKGLEYDLVILADAAHRFNERDRYGKVIVSERGVFVKVPNSLDRTLQKTAPWILENFKAPDRMRAEELRLLYVALTRAKNTLIVSGTNAAALPENPRDGKRMLDFLRNVPALPPDVEPREIGGGAECELFEYPDIVEEIKRRHAKVAQYNENRRTSALPIKTCVTAVAHRTPDETEDYTRTAPVLTVDDRDRREGSEDAAAIGTAYHRAMELVDFAAPDMEYVRENCDDFDRVNEREILAAAQAMKELVRDCAFYAKERYFIVNMPAREVYVDASASDESILVQGVIDLLIVDKQGNATVIDYKTGDPRRLDNDAYRTQLRLYAAAVEKTTPYKVKRVALYSFASGRLIG